MEKNTNDYYHADYVKCNAFLYLLRIKYQINANNKGEFVILAENDPLVSEWANKAYSGLANMCPIENQNEVELNDLRNKAIELVKYLNAYDMLKTGGWIVEGADKKWNKDLCLPRNKLRVFAASLYRRSDGIINSTSGWKKNHGIICASALGMAAI